MIQQFQNTFQTQILEVLQSWLTNSTQANEHRLTQFSQKQNFCLSLMRIVQILEVSIQIKKAALLYLAKTIDFKWDHHDTIKQISASQKQQIKKSLINVIVGCQKNKSLMKNYRKVISLILKNQNQLWNPLILPQNWQKNVQNQFHILYYSLAVCSIFRKDKIKSKILRDYINSLLPKLKVILNVVKNHQKDYQLSYLLIKILYNCICLQRNISIKQLVYNQMDFLQKIIFKVGEYMQSKIIQPFAQNTIQFYYFHSKKWATKIVQMFAQKHILYCEYNNKFRNTVSKLSESWFQNYGYKFYKSILHQLSQQIPSTNKIRFYELKILRGILNQKPAIIQFQQIKQLQFQILPKFMVMTEENQIQAHEKVFKYLQNGYNQSLKNEAALIWRNFLTYDKKYEKKQQFGGPLFQLSWNYIKKSIQSQNQWEKQRGLYILCANHVKLKIPSLLEQIEDITLLNMQNHSIFVRARICDIVLNYCINPDRKRTSSFISFLHKSLQDASDLVKIRALKALNKIIINRSFLDSRLNLKLIQQTLAKLIEKYPPNKELISLIQQLIQGVDQNFPSHINPTIQILSRVFNLLWKAQPEKDQGAILCCIQTIIQVIKKIKKQFTPKIEQKILDIVKCLLMQMSEVYETKMLQLLQLYLEKIKSLSSKCWLYFQAVIFFVVGVPSQAQNKFIIQSFKQEVLLNLLKNNYKQKLSRIKLAIPVIINYFGVVSKFVKQNIIQSQYKQLGLVIYFAERVYSIISNKKLSEKAMSLSLSSILLVYFVEIFPKLPEEYVRDIIQMINLNIKIVKQKNLEKITCQLIGVLLWKHSSLFLQMVQEGEINISEIIIYVKENSQSFILKEQKKQRTRIILGVFSLLMSAQENMSILKPYILYLYNIFAKLVTKSCYQRLLRNTKSQQEKQQYQNILNNFQEPQRQIIEQQQKQDYYQEDSYSQEIHEPKQKPVQGLVKKQNIESNEERIKIYEDIWQQFCQSKTIVKSNKFDIFNYLKVNLQKIYNKQTITYKTIAENIPQKEFEELKCLLQKCCALKAQPMMEQTK